MIGNAAYPEQPLKNPRNDATDVAAVFRQAGVTTTLATDLGRVELNRTVGRFLSQADGAELAVVYYSGHGMQSGGESYLIPVDARIESEHDVRAEGLRLGELMGDLEGRRIRRIVVVLDACRDNPFNTRARSVKRGLAPPKEMGSAFLVAYATSDGMTAADGRGRNGTYTTELLKQLNVSGKSLRDVLEETELAVDAATGGAQKPVTYGSTARFRAVTLWGTTVTTHPPTVATQPKPRRTDNTLGPVVRYSDGTMHVNVRGSSHLLLATCEEGTRYESGVCAGRVKLYSLDEAHETARLANERAFAGYTNWRVPDYMDILGVYANLDSELRSAGLARPETVDPFGLDVEMADKLFPTGRAGLATWMLPRGGKWNESGTTDIGGGIRFTKQGRYPLRLVRNLQ